MADPKDNLLDWLRDAHAMEQQAEQMLKGQASRLEHYPKLKARIEQHIAETQQQRELLEGCISRLGGSPSVLKDLAEGHGLRPGDGRHGVPGRSGQRRHGRLRL